MSLVNKALPSLVAGMSQQPDELRFDGQADEIINATLGIATGVMKRPGTELIAQIPLSQQQSWQAAIHMWGRDTNEKYLVAIMETTIRAFTLEGAEVPVNIGQYPPNYNFDKVSDASYANSIAYITSANPRKNIRFSTFADFTFVLNRTTTVKSTDIVAPSPNATLWYLNFKYAATGVTYTFTLKYHRADINQDVEKVFSIVSDSNSIAAVAKKTADYINTNYFNNTISVAPATLMGDDSVVKIVPTTDVGGHSFVSIEVTDTYGNQGCLVVHGEVELYSDLPNAVNEGDIIKITGSGASAVGYYVKYSKGRWRECVEGHATGNDLDPSTMPHALTRGEDGQFYFHPLKWATRQSGDDTTNPKPSFVGRALSDIFFHRSRLGFLCEENVILSKSASFFNFWRDTVTTTLDTDLIDVAANSARVVNFRHAVSFNKDLIIFSDNAQYVLSGGVPLTATNTSISESTAYAADPDVRPTAVDDHLLFMSSRNGCAQIREYITVNNGASFQTQSDDITAHVPTLVAGEVHEIISSPELGITLVLTEEANKLYAYQSTKNGQEKVQSAWSIWRFGWQGTEVISVEFVGPLLYLLVLRSGIMCLEVMDFALTKRDGQMPFAVSLDRKTVSVNAGVYDEANDTTTFTIPATDPDDFYAVVVDKTTSEEDGTGMPQLYKPVVGMPIPKGAIISMDTPVDTPILLGSTLFATRVLTLEGDWSGLTVVFGIPFEFTYTFSRQFLRGQDNLPLTNIKVKVRRMHLKISRAGDFGVIVWPRDRMQYTGDTSGYGQDNLTGAEGSDYFVYNYKPVYSNASAASTITEADYLLYAHPYTFSFPVMTSADNMAIGIQTQSYVPVAFYGAEWDGYMTMRSRRI